MSRNEYYALILLVLISFVWTWLNLYALVLYFSIIFPYAIARIAKRRYLLYGILANTMYWIWAGIFYGRYPDIIKSGNIGFLGFMIICAICVCAPMHILDRVRKKRENRLGGSDIVDRD